MRRYKFRLEAVLRHREIIEELREQEFAAANGVLEVILARIAALWEEFNRTVAERPGAEAGQPFDPHIIVDRERYLQTLQAEIASQERRADAARIVVEEARQALVVARQGREAVSRLREKDRAAYILEAQRHEQNTLDEMATVRHLQAVRARASVSAAIKNPKSEIPNQEAA